MALSDQFLVINFVTWNETIMSIHGDVQFVSQLKYKTHVAVIEKFTFMTSILNAVAQFQLSSWKRSQN